MIVHIYLDHIQRLNKGQPWQNNPQRMELIFFSYYKRCCYSNLLSRINFRNVICNDPVKMSLFRIRLKRTTLYWIPHLCTYSCSILQVYGYHWNWNTRTYYCGNQFKIITSKGLLLTYMDIFSYLYSGFSNLIRYTGDYINLSFLKAHV